MKLGHITNLAPNEALNKVADWARRVGTNELKSLKDETVVSITTDTEYKELSTTFQTVGGLIVIMALVQVAVNDITVNVTGKLFVDDKEEDSEILGGLDRHILFYAKPLPEGEYKVKTTFSKSGGTATTNGTGVSRLHIFEFLGS